MVHVIIIKTFALHIWVFVCIISMAPTVSLYLWTAEKYVSVYLIVIRYIYPSKCVWIGLSSNSWHVWFTHWNESLSNKLCIWCNLLSVYSFLITQHDTKLQFYCLSVWKPSVPSDQYVTVQKDPLLVFFGITQFSQVPALDTWYFAYFYAHKIQFLIEIFSIPWWCHTKPKI